MLLNGKKKESNALSTIEWVIENQLEDEAIFGDETAEDDSYQYVMTQIDINYRNMTANDNSIILQQLAKLVTIIENPRKTLQEVYKSALRYIHSIDRYKEK